MAAFAVGLAGWPCADAIAASSRCNVSRVLGRSADAVVFRSAVQPNVVSRYRTLSCDRRTGAIRRLDNPLDPDYPSSIHRVFDVSGPYAVVLKDLNDFANTGEGAAFLQRINVLRGRVLWLAEPAFGGGEGFDDVTSAVVRANGAAAWIERRHERHSVHARYSRSTRSVVSAGGNVSPRSLRLDAASISWVEDGDRRTASLP